MRAAGGQRGLRGGAVWAGLALRGLASAGVLRGLASAGVLRDQQGLRRLQRLHHQSVQHVYQSVPAGATGGGGGSADSECDDRNTCTVDRCLGGACRHSAPLPGCCMADADCDDGDPCALTLCNTVDSACLDPVQVSPGPGLVCCAEASECADGDASTLDVCDLD